MMKLKISTNYVKRGWKTVGHCMLVLFTLMIIIKCTPSKSKEDNYTFRIDEIESAQEFINQIDYSDKDKPIFIVDTFNYQFIDFLDGSKLFFIDLNKDGIYVNPHEDAVEIAHKSIKNLHEFHKNFVPMNDTFNFMIDGNYFKIDKFDLRNKKIFYSIDNRQDESTKINGSVITKFPQGNFINLSEDSLSFDTYKSDGKFLLVEFWGTWCPGCIQKIPETRKIYTNNKNVLEILSLNKGDSIDRVKEFIVENNMDWQHGILNSSLTEEFGDFRGFPSSFLFNDAGELIMKNPNSEDLDKILNLGE